MTEYYYRTTFDDYKDGLMDFSLTNPATQTGKHSVFEYFKEDTHKIYLEGKVVLACTLTIPPGLKHSGRVVFDASPERQHTALKYLINSALRKYHKKYNVSIKAYFFFEAHPGSGRLHAHGIFSQLNDEMYYPIFLPQLKACFLKVGFKSRACDVSYIKHFNEWSEYICKDHGKHRFTPLYVFI